MSFEIEKEYDNRYEGFDYDDVDEETRSRQVLPRHHPSSHHDVAPDFTALVGRERETAEDPLDALERAEEQYEEQHARKPTATRLLERIEKKEKKKEVHHHSGIGASVLSTSQARLAAAIAANPHLKGVQNPQAAAAALTLALAPLSCSKSTALSKLAHASRAVASATSPAALDALKNTTSTSNNSHAESAPRSTHINFIVGKVKTVLAHSSSCGDEDSAEDSSFVFQQQEQAVRGLLELASYPHITLDVLAQCDGAGKKIRKLKNHGCVAVGQAAACCVEAWKRSIHIIQRNS